MTAKDVIKSACIYLGIYDDFSSYFSGGTNYLSTENATTLEKLFLSLNYVLTTLCSGFIKLIKKQTLTTTIDGKIGFDQFDKKPCRLCCIADASSSRKLKFKVFDDFIQTDFVGAVDVEYCYFLDKISSLTDEISLFQISEKALAFGVVREYLYINGLFDDAKIWDERFSVEVNKNLAKPKVVVMPKRKWF